MADTTTASTDAGATTDTGATDDTNNTTTDTDQTDWKAEAEKWKNLSRKNEQTARKAQTELDKAQQASMSDLEKAVAEAKAAGRAEAETSIQRERVADKVAIAAAGKLADPGDAAALLGDLDQFLVSGQIDTKAIGIAIDQLLAAKPYLGAKPGNGSGEGGPRGASQDTALNGDPLVKSLEAKLGKR